jgi:preprotein translocase subunit SecF
MPTAINPLRTEISIGTNGLVGIIAGTYSSIALATPLLVAVERYLGKKK